MIQIISGKYGPKLLGPGSVVSLDDATEQRLVDRKVAVFINKTNDESNSGSSILTDNATKENITVLSEDEIKKIKSKKELIKYAESIGLHDLKETDPKDTLIDAIVNYQEEQFSEV